MDLKLNDQGDLDLSTGDLQLVDGIDAIRQRCIIRLKLFKGECFWDMRVGMPYYQEVLGVKPFSAARVQQRFRQALLGVPGVRDVVSITTNLNAATRELTVSFQAVAEVDGSTNVFSGDFVLT